MTLLQELCKREKRPNPRYDQLNGKGDGVQFRVVLQVGVQSEGDSTARPCTSLLPPPASDPVA